MKKFLFAPLAIFLFAFAACSKSSSKVGGGSTPPPPSPSGAQPPVISAISPTSALAGDTVVITGSHFDATATADTVSFNGASGVVVKATSTQLTVIVPVSATTGNVVVATAGGHSGGAAFTVKALAQHTIYIIGSDTRYGTGFWINSAFTPMADNSSVYDLKGSGSDFYIAGPSTSNTPTYWRNDTAVHLSSQTGYTWSIFVSGKDVYNLGLIGTDFYVWKNGTPTPLTTTSLITFTHNGYYSSSNLFVSNGDAYVAGAEYLGNSIIPKATYWKNGSPNDLTDGIHTGPAWANAVAVSGTDVYVAGIEQIQDPVTGGITNLAPRLWKNGVSIPINAPTQSLYTNIYCLLINGNDVYIGGTYNGAGAVWKNGNLLDSATYAVAENVSSIFLYNQTDLYVTGASSAWGLNGYWLNGHFVEMDPGCQVAGNSCAGTTANQAVAIYVR